MDRNKRYLFIVILCAAVAVIIAIAWNFLYPRLNYVNSPFQVSQTRSDSSFTVTAAGDYGANIHTDQVLHAIRKTTPEFHLTLGDFGYDEVRSEEEWCDYIKKHVGDLPFELLSGNHESDGLDGFVEKYIECLPNKIPGIVGDYGKQYYFDYPATTSLARFILISPGLTFGNGETYSYKPGTDRFNWLKKAVDEAKKENIPWVVVLMHKNCIVPGQYECLIGYELMNYLVQNTDLILQAHGHIYTRSKQLNCVVAGGRGIVYSEDCVAKNSLNTVYKQGNGGVLVAGGTAGRALRAIVQSDETVNYFEKVMGLNISPTYGFLQLQVSKNELRTDFVPVEGKGFRDTFVIQR